jgi:hypothetical protein
MRSDKADMNRQTPTEEERIDNACKFSDLHVWNQGKNKTD